MDDRVYAGIDLGATYSSLAVYSPGSPAVVEKNMDGVTDMPSAVFFDISGDAVVGTGAKEKLPYYPDQTASFFKRDMGKDVEYTF